MDIMNEIYLFVSQGSKARMNLIKYCDKNNLFIDTFNEHNFIYTMNALANAYDGEYMFDEAIKALKSILLKYEKYTVAHIKTAHLMVKQHKLDEAIEYLENVLEEIKSHPYYYTDLLTGKTKLHYQYKSDIHCLPIHIQELRDKKLKGYVYKPRKKNK